MEMVIVPLHRRPAFAMACLTRLYKAAENDDSLHFHIAIDAAPHREVVEIAQEFARKVGPDRVEIVRRRQSFRGNSYNVMTSYKEVINSGAEIIHLVEEDVLVGKDYFDYHRQVREIAPGAFSVCACRNQFWPLDAGPPDEEDAVYLQGCYQSIGVSFTPDKLAHVVEHAVTSFFINPLPYLRKHFPHSSLGDSYREQDGLIYRVIEAGECVSAFPCVPRAYHAGFSGYNRAGAALPGTTEEQARRILTMTADELNAQARSYRDYETIALDGVREPVTRILEWF